ncbi:MAG: hypothetical protein ABIW38_13425 [Ferruginibacter sp.]
MSLLSRYSKIIFILASTLMVACKKDEGPAQPTNESANYLVSTFAGSGQGGLFDALGTSARFTGPTAITSDAQNNIYVVDAGNFAIRKITSAGMVTTLAGGQQGYANGTGPAAQFYNPIGITADASGNIYVAEETRIRKITAAGVVTSLAGNTTPGYVDGTGTAALFSAIRSITIDGQGNIYVLDFELPACRIRVISPVGNVTTFMTVSLFSTAIAMNAQGNLYLVESGILDYNIQQITPAKVVTRISNTPQPIGITISQGTIFLTGYKTDLSNGNSYLGVYRINVNNPFTLIAGETRVGYLDGNGNTAQFATLAGITADSNGNLYIADKDNNRIRKVTRK